MPETYVYTAGFQLVPVSRLMEAGGLATDADLAQVAAALQAQIDNLANKKAVAFMNTPADPAPITSTSPVMMGIDQAFTPVSDGQLLVTVSGQLSNTTNNQSVTLAICAGEGAPPAHGDPQTGSVLGTPTTASRATTGSPSVPFSDTVLWTGLKAATAYWLGLALSVSGGSGSVTALTITGVEV